MNILEWLSSPAWLVVDYIIAEFVLSAVLMSIGLPAVFILAAVIATSAGVLGWALVGKRGVNDG